jgi:anti-sigma factor RsiW
MRLARELACNEIVELVTAYLEDALPVDDRERFEEHLVFCDGCDRYLEQMRVTIATTGRVDLGALPLELEERLLEAFRDWRSSS